MIQATSRAAHKQIQSLAPTLRDQVYHAIRGQGSHGATDDEVQEMLHLGGNTERPRRRELQEQGFIYDSASTRLTRSGRKSIVWLSVTR